MEFSRPPSTARCLAQLCKFGHGKQHLGFPSRRVSTRPPQAPKVAIDIKHIRKNPSLYAETCVQRKYEALQGYPDEIIRLHDQWDQGLNNAKALRQLAKKLQSKLTTARLGDMRGRPSNTSDEEAQHILNEARIAKERLQEIDKDTYRLSEEMQRLAEALPNVTSPQTPIGHTPTVVGYINEDVNLIAELAQKTRSHIDIGSELHLLDFTSAGTVSGWGWYYLKNEAALLEQALVQYALSVAIKHGFQPVSPPSVVYSHISSACGFQPRDQGGEQQVYLLQQEAGDSERGRPELSLTGTAEIPFAGMMAKTDLPATQLPLRVVGSSRCYRAEAGSRGVDTKGLYRVHEFTKVEMFGWTAPNEPAATELFDLMIAVQTKILKGLGLYCRVLEQPSTDLGASATRKQDIEASFPSRQDRDGGWGEVTSTSICTDYQARRLATRLRGNGNGTQFPYTVNGTALAVPRVLAALLETHWSEPERSVRVPEVLWPWMHGVKVIAKKESPCVI